MALVAKNIPPVSREFALELKKVFRPYSVKPGFDRDELMRSVGQQEVIEWILRQSRNSTIKSPVYTNDIYPTDSINTDNIPSIDTTINNSNINTIDNTNKKSWYSIFTNRFGI